LGSGFIGRSPDGLGESKSGDKREAIGDRAIFGETETFDLEVGGERRVALEFAARIA
jgi:hypothetical protein